MRLMFLDDCDDINVSVIDNFWFSGGYIYFSRLDENSGFWKVPASRIEFNRIAYNLMHYSFADIKSLSRCNFEYYSEEVDYEN